MKIITLIVVLIIIVTFGVMYLKYRLVNPPDKKNLEASVDLEVTKAIKSGYSHGLVIGIYKDGKTFIKGYGTIDRNSTTTPNGTTIFQIASISKLFTSSTYQILSDEKKFDMDATLNDLIGTNIALSSEAKRVTLRQLATHTSGFPSIPEPLELEVKKIVKEEDLMQNPYAHLGPRYIFDYLKTTEGKREPGSFEYSNFGMGLLGHLMEVVTKKDLESLVKEKIFTPLDMENTGITLTSEMLKHLAQGYTDNGEKASVWTFAALAGAGAFNSNVEDMLKFIKANIETNNSLFSQSLSRTHEPQLNGNTSIGWMQPTFIDRFVGNSSILWHNGMVGGYASYLSIDTINKTGIVVLSNTSVDVTILGMMLTRQVITQSFKN